MNDYKTGCPAYLEFVNKSGENTRGIFYVTEQDRWNIELRDEEVYQIVAKKKIKVYEPDREKWPKWCK